MREFSSMVLAAEWGNQSVIEALVFAGANVNAMSTDSEQTALTIAVKQQDTKLIRFLLASGAYINNRLYPGFDCSALKTAAENGDIDMARFLLDEGADPNDPAALEQAAYKNDELFDLLLKRYYARYPTSRGDFGVRVLAKAVVDGNERVVRLMLERRVNANVMIYLGDQMATAFGQAITSQQDNFTGCLELFLQIGCHPDDIVSKADRLEGPPPMITAFLAAIGTRNMSTVELLIRYDADINFPTRGRIKRTPLQRAAEVGSLDIFDVLLNHGANVHAPAAERGGGTAIQLAAIGEYIPIVCKLLSHNADPNAPASKVNGRTALEGAAEYGRLDTVQVLLNGGAAAKPSDEAQIKKAVALAKENGHIPICNLLDSHLVSLIQSSGLEFLADDDNGEFPSFNLDDDPFPLVDFDQISLGGPALAQFQRATLFLSIHRYGFRTHCFSTKTGPT